MVNSLEGNTSRASVSKRVVFVFLLCCSIAIAGWSAVTTADSPHAAPGLAQGVIDDLFPASPYLLANHTMVYVVNQHSNNVSVIDTLNNTVVGSIDVGQWPNHIVVNPSHSRAYVTNEGSRSISVIDTATNAVIGQIDLEIKPTNILFSPSGTRFYVTNYSKVLVIDAANSQVVHTINVYNSGYIDISPSGDVLYLLTPYTTASDNFTAIDVSNDMILANIPIPFSSFSMAVSPDGRFVFIGDYSGNNLAVVNTLDYSVTYQQLFGEGEYQMHGITFSREGALAYVANTYCIDHGMITSNISIIDASTFQVLEDIPIEKWPTKVTMDPLRKIAYALVWAKNNATVIDLAENKTITNVSVGIHPTDMVVFTPPVPRARAYVANFGSDNVSVIDVATEKVIKSIDVGRRPADIAVSPDGNYVFVTNFLDNSLSVIETTNNTVCATIPVGRNPWGVDIRNDGAIVYVVNTGDRNVTAIDVTGIVTGTYRLYDSYDMPLVGHGTHNMPLDIVVNPAERAAYVSNMGGYLTRINLDTSAVTVIDFDGRPRLWMLDVNTDGSRLFISCLDDCAYVMTLSPLRIDFAGASWGIEAGPDDSKFYIGNATGITVVNSGTRNIMKWIPTHAESVSAMTTDIAIKDDGKRIYATNANFNRVVTINATANKPDGWIDVGKFPVAIAIKPATSNPLPSQPPLPPNVRSYTASADWKPANASMPDATVRDMLLQAGVDLTAGSASPTQTPSAVPGWGITASCAGLAMAGLIAIGKYRNRRD